MFVCIVVVELHCCFCGVSAVLRRILPLLVAFCATHFPTWSVDSAFCLADFVSFWPLLASFLTSGLRACLVWVLLDCFSCFWPFFVAVGRIFARLFWLCIAFAAHVFAVGVVYSLPLAVVCAALGLFLGFLLFFS